MNETIQFELVPEKIPRITKKASRYDPILDKFTDMDNDSVRINTINMKPRELAIALRSRVRARNLMDEIKVSQRGDKVYLIKVVR